MRSKTLTEKQIEANRRRAQKSTGPKTPEGKARSRTNALKHGLYAKTLLNFNENERLVDEITRQLYEDFPPANANERMLIEMMILAQWRLLRITRSRIPPNADWATDCKLSLDQEKMYASMYRSYTKCSAELKRSRAARGLKPPVAEREDVAPIPVDPWEDPLSQMNAASRNVKEKELRNPGFVPENQDPEPPKREKLPYEYDQSEFAPYDRDKKVA